MLIDDLLNTPWSEASEIQAIEDEGPKWLQGIEAQHKHDGTLKITVNDKVIGPGPDDTDGKSIEEFKALLQTMSGSERAEFKRRAQLYSRRISEYLDSHLLMTTESLNGDAARRTVFREGLKHTQKFYLSNAFVATTLERLATAETVVKARELFKLPHSPMWFEWSGSAFSSEMTGMKFGAMLENVTGHAGRPAILAYMILYITAETEKFNMGASAHSVVFYPDSAELQDDGMYVDMRSDEFDVRAEEAKWVHGQVKLLFDFIIRINSPRVTEIREGDDLTALNKKRIRGGKLPLHSLCTVDLSAEVKAALKQAGAAEDTAEGHVRYHLRRGHYKVLTKRVKAPGLYWWNPHTAGREKLGKVEHDYVA